MANVAVNAITNNNVFKWWLSAIILIPLITLITVFNYSAELKLPLVFLPVILGFIPVWLFIIYKKPSSICIVLILFLYFRFQEIIPLLSPARIPLLLIISVSLSVIINLYF